MVILHRFCWYGGWKEWIGCIGNNVTTTPLRLIDALDKGLRLDTVRLVVLDEADRLLDAADGRHQLPPRTNQKDHKIKKQKDDNNNNNNNNDSSSSTSSCNEETSDDDEEREKEDDGNNDHVQSTSGSYQTQTFLAQMDIILSATPTSAVRAPFSATVTQTVKILSESILRNPVDVTVSFFPEGNDVRVKISSYLLFTTLDTIFWLHIEKAHDAKTCNLTTSRHDVRS
jgi:DEAD/DEAH box helicase